MMALSEGHQCHPSALNPRATVSPTSPERQRRQGGLLRRIHRITRQSRHAHHAVVLCEVGLQGVVVNRPVVRDAVQGLDLEIRRVQSREMRGVKDGAAADAIEVDHGNVRIAVVDRIVRIQPADVGVDVVRSEGLAFPVGRVGRVLRRVHPVALFETDDAHAGIRQAPRYRRPRSTGSDDQHVYNVLDHGLPSDRFGSV